MELIFRSDKELAGQLCNLLCHQLGEASRRIQPGAHSGTPQRQLMQGRNSQLQQLRILFQTGTPAGNLLAELDGSSVLHGFCRT